MPPVRNNSQGFNPATEFRKALNNAGQALDKMLKGAPAYAQPAKKPVVDKKDTGSNGGSGNVVVPNGSRKSSGVSNREPVRGGAQATQQPGAKPIKPQSERKVPFGPYQPLPQQTITTAPNWFQQKSSEVSHFTKGLGEGFKYGDGSSRMHQLERIDVNNRQTWQDGNQGNEYSFGLGGRLRMAADVVPFVSSFTNHHAAKELSGDRGRSVRDLTRTPGMSNKGSPADIQAGKIKAEKYGVTAEQLAKKARDELMGDAAVLGTAYFGGPLIGKASGALINGAGKLIKGFGAFARGAGTTATNVAPAASSAGAVVPRTGAMKAIVATTGKQALKAFENGEKLADAAGPTGTAAGLYYFSMKAKLGEVAITTSDKIPGVKQKVSAIMNENGAENSAIGAAPQVVVYTTKPGSKEADNYFIASMGGSVLGSKIYRANDLVNDAKNGQIKSLETYIDWGKANVIVQSLAKKNQVGAGGRATVLNGATGYVSVTFGPPDANTRWKVSGGAAAVNATVRGLGNYNGGPRDKANNQLTNAPGTIQPYVNVYNSWPGKAGAQKPNVGPVQLSVQSGFYGPGGVAGYSTSTQPLKRGFNIDIGGSKKVGFRGENSPAGAVKAFTMTINGNKRTMALDQIMKRDFPGAAKEVGGQLGGFTDAVFDAQSRVLLRGE
jgi:hypothetical protein